MVINASKFFEVTKYLSLTNHTYSAIILMVSKRMFDKLTPEQQTAMREAGKETCAEQRRQNARNVERTIGELRAKGMEVNRIGNVAGFREKVRSEERRGGKEGVSTWRSRWAPDL